jgi:hypothetical protein
MDGMDRPLTRKRMRLIGRGKSWIRVVNGGPRHKSPALTSGVQRATWLVNRRGLVKVRRPQTADVTADLTADLTAR